MKILMKKNCSTEPTVITSLGAVILSNLMPKMYPIIERYPDIAMAYYKGLNCFLELLVCNNQVRLIFYIVKNLN